MRLEFTDINIESQSECSYDYVEVILLYIFHVFERQWEKFCRPTNVAFSNFYFAAFEKGVK